MALTVNHLVSNVSASDSQTYTTASFTPTANALIIACFHNSFDTGGWTSNYPTISDTAGLTWSSDLLFNDKDPHNHWLVNSGNVTGARNMWAAQAPSSPGAMTVTINWGTLGAPAPKNAMWSVFEVIGSDVVNGVAQTFVQLVASAPTIFGSSPGTSATTTLAAANNSNNRPFLWVIHSNLAEATTPRTNWTELGDVNTSDHNVSMETQWRSDAFETTASASWTTSSDYSLVAFEIKAGLPTVTTQAVTSITESTATGNGNITVIGLENADKRGIVYSTSTHTNPGNVAPASSGYASSVEESGGSYSTGAFTESLTGLTSSTVYYARAYAHNSAGYSYGDEVSFITTHAANSPVTSVTNPTLGEATVWRNRILYGIDQPNTTYTQNDDVGGVWMIGNAEPQMPLVNSLYFMVSATSAAPYRPWGVRMGGMYADQTQTVKMGYQDTQATATSAQYHIGTLDTIYTGVNSPYAYYITLPINADTDAKKLFHSIRPTMSGKSSSTMGISIYYRLNVDATSLYDNNNTSQWTFLRTVTTDTTNPTTPIRKIGRNIQFKFVFVPASGFSPQLTDYTIVFEPLDQYR